MENQLKLSILSFLSEVAVVTLAVYLPYRAFQLGADSLTAGLVGGTSSIVYMFMPLMMGRLSDRFGAKRVFLIGSFLLFLVSLSYFLLTNLNLIIIMRVIEGLGWAMVWPPLESMVSSDSTNTYKSLARFNMSWGLGATLAPSLGAMIEGELNLRYTLLFASICMLITLSIAPTLRTNVTHTAKSDNFVTRQRHFVLTPLYFTSMYGVATTVITTFFPKYASVNALNVIEWGGIISSFLFARLVAFTLAERIRRRIGIKNMFAPFSFMSLVFPTTAIFEGSNFPFLLMSSMVTGFSTGLVYSAALNKVMIDTYGGKGGAAGMFESSIGMGSFLGPLLAGAIAARELWAFLLVPVATMLICGLLGVIKKESLSINSSS
ncbi:MAG: MFS transporter [Conexivisphaerales archaeon]